MAVTDIGKRRERAKHIPAVPLRTEVALDPPQRDENPSLDAKLFLDVVESLGPLLGLDLAFGDAPLVSHGIDVVAEGLAVFRLALGCRDHALVGRHALQR